MRATCIWIRVAGAHVCEAGIHRYSSDVCLAKCEKRSLQVLTVCRITRECGRRIASWRPIVEPTRKLPSEVDHSVEPWCAKLIRRPALSIMVSTAPYPEREVRLHCTGNGKDVMIRLRKMGYNGAETRVRHRLAGDISGVGKLQAYRLLQVSSAQTQCR
jgi:hypothetical protein